MGAGTITTVGTRAGKEQSVCIVVVDDEPELRHLMSNVLEDEGYRVVSFSHPVPVTRLQETDERPNLFLIDIMLPDMNGIELAHRLVTEGFGGTPKIAMSASHQCVRDARASHLFDAALEKPFEINDLLDMVERHMLT
jgi:two-component system, NtrC family, nitrogen regulation response regulator NtrX